MNNLKQMGLGMLLYTNDFGGYLYPRSSASNPLSRGNDYRYGQGYLVTYVWGNRYTMGELWSCPSKPVTDAASEVMEDWGSQVTNTGAANISYPSWNADQTANDAWWPDIYGDGDFTNGEYPMKAGRGNDSSIIIANDMLGASGGNPRAGYANHSEKGGYGIGANTLYLDGHVKWKTVDAMEPLDGPGAGSSFFW